MDSHAANAWDDRLNAVRKGSKAKRSALPNPSANALNLQPLPRWILASDDPIFAGGAAVFALDQIIRADPAWLGCWRMRQALAGAAAISKLLRLNAAEADLRDVHCLTRVGDDPGPAGRVYRLLRQFSARPLRLSEDCLAQLAAEIKGAAAGEEILALLRQDLLLAQKLNWPTPVLLAATVITDPALRSPAGFRLAANQPSVLAKAAIVAHASAVTLERQSQALRQAAALLRTRDGGKGLALILNDDCVAPWRMVHASGVDAGLGSDRAARRLCETLAGQGVLRLLTNRPTFRLYGI